MEKLRYGDEYRGLSEFAKKVRTINFNFQDDSVNGIFEVDYDNPDMGYMDMDMDMQQEDDSTMAMNNETTQSQSINQNYLTGEPEKLPPEILKLKKESEKASKKNSAAASARLSQKSTDPLSRESPNVERYEAEGQEWIRDHTGVKRKPF